MSNSFWCIMSQVNFCPTTWASRWAADWAPSTTCSRCTTIIRRPNGVSDLYRVRATCDDLFVNNVLSLWENLIIASARQLGHSTALHAAPARQRRRHDHIRRVGVGHANDSAATENVSQRGHLRSVVHQFGKSPLQALSQFSYSIQCAFLCF